MGESVCMQVQEIQKCAARVDVCYCKTDINRYSNVYQSLAHKACSQTESVEADQEYIFSQVDSAVILTTKWRRFMYAAKFSFILRSYCSYIVPQNLTTIVAGDLHLYSTEYVLGCIVLLLSPLYIMYTIL